VQRTHSTVLELARCDAEGTRTGVHRGMDSLVVEYGIARPRDTHEKVRGGVKARVEEESRREGEGPHEAGFERCVGVVVYKAGAA
jgi:hypothetical protein